MWVNTYQNLAAYQTEMHGTLFIFSKYVVEV